MEIFRLCQLQEAIHIIECILNKKIENKLQDQQRPGDVLKEQSFDEQNIIEDKSDNEIPKKNPDNDSDAKPDDKHDVILNGANKEEKIEAAHPLDEAIDTEVNEKSVPFEEIPNQNPENDSDACHISDSSFQTVQELTKHISGNLHDFSIYHESETYTYEIMITYSNNKRAYLL